MPLYDYACRGCGHTFEALVRSSTIPVCPRCESQDLERVLSAPAVTTKEKHQAALGIARKKLRKEQRGAEYETRQQYTRDHDH